MQDNNKNSNNMHPNGCMCGTCNVGSTGMCMGMCGYHGHGRHVILRWFLGIFIIFSIFSIGMKVGELQYRIEASEGGGYYRMMRYQPMMYGDGSGIPLSAGVVNTPLSTTTRR